ncbi:MAG: hypothetical protein E7476_14865 [Ruminococcaceae bacterium]|nr:hypothetical protein [Oscillospiraceae bacterium]
MPNIIHSGGGVNIMTLPDQITNLACVGGTNGTTGTIDVSFTEVPASSWSLLQNYLLVYKAGGIPQTPFDGTRIVLSKGAAGAQKTHQISGLTFDQLYGVRIYPISTRYQHQTAAEGATAAATPVNYLHASDLLGCMIKLPEDGNTIDFLALKSNYQNSGGTLAVRKEAITSMKMTWSSKQTYANAYVGSSMDTWLLNTYLPKLSAIQDALLEPSIQVIAGAGDYITVNTVQRKAFLLSASEYNLKALSSFADIPSVEDGEPIPYFDSLSKTYTWFSNTTGSTYAKVGTRTPATTPGGSSPGRYAIELISSSGSTPFVAIVSITSYDASSGFSPRPAICLSDSLLFSPIPNADGSYSPI